jgi:flagellar hook-associated protein 3 FlgL
MRVSQQQVTEQVLFHLNAHLDGLQRLQTQLASGKRIGRASDDPTGAALSLDLHAQVGQTQQYRHNVEDGLGFAKATDIALGDAHDILRQARTLLISGAKDSLGDGDRQALGTQVRNLRDALLRVANSDFDGRKLFGGTVTDTNPVSLAGDGTASYAGNSEDILRLVSKEFQQAVNVAGDEAFNVSGAAVPGTADTFKILTDIASDIENGNVLSLSETRLQEMDAVLQNTLRLRADVGARINTLEMVKNRTADMETTLRERLSETEEANLPEVISQLLSEQNAYQAALAATARIVPPSLMDFLQ